MPRSSYIYIVVDKDKTLIAGFTVKHELMRWLEKHYEVGYKMWRVPDGGSRAPAEMVLELEVTDGKV